MAGNQILFQVKKKFQDRVVACINCFLICNGIEYCSYRVACYSVCSALVLSLEIINTSIEKLSNIISTSFHSAIKLVKDMAAGAVFLVSVISLIIACIIFLPKIEPFIKYFFK